MAVFHVIPFRTDAPEPVEPRGMKTHVDVQERRDIPPQRALVLGHAPLPATVPVAETDGCCRPYSIGT